MVSVPTNGRTGWWVAGILAILLTGVVARQVEWNSIGGIVATHLEKPAHTGSDTRLRKLEDAQLKLDGWRINVDRQLKIIAKKVGAEVVIP